MNLVYQFTLLPGLWFAVDIVSEHLVTTGIDDPLGVADILGDIVAMRNPLDLSDCLESIGDTFLGGEVLLLSPVTSVGLSGRDMGTVNSSRECAGSLGNTHTDLLRSWNAGCLDGAGADVF